MKKKHVLVISCFLVIMTIIACHNDDNDYDATGTFEATEVTVAAENTGKIVTFNVEEGDTLRRNERVGLIDTVQLALSALRIGATTQSIATRRPDIQKQMAATKQQLAQARKEVERYENLVADGAANGKLLDDARSTVNVIEGQLAAQRSALDNSTRSLNSQMSAADIQRAQVIDQIAKCHIYAPLTGTVTAKYAEQGEYAVTGQPLFTIADLKHMFLRAYFTSAQLASVRIGQQVKVFPDYGGNSATSYDGTITWISPQAEFTPKTILTADERAALVYAVKIAVNNDGYLKIGMYGKVKL